MTSLSIAIESFKLFLTMSVYWTEFIKQQYEKHRYHERNDRKWTFFLINVRSDKSDEYSLSPWGYQGFEEFSKKGCKQVRT